jgi:mannose-6-phosphate isomerase class I
MGLDWDTALEAADFSAMSLDYLNNYIHRTPEIVREENGNVEEKLVPDEAKQFFNLARFKVSSKMSIPGDQGFYCLINTKGSGIVRGSFGDVPIKRGKSLFIPACLPGYELVNDGDEVLEALFCYPPEV